MSKKKQLPVGFTVNSIIAEEIQSQLQEDMLSCAKAHALALKFSVSPSEIGHTADALNIRLNRCQLGLFGYPNKKGWEASGVIGLPVPDGFEDALLTLAADASSISCSEFWEFISGYQLSRMHAGYIADKLGIRITNCQIGAF